MTHFAKFMKLCAPTVQSWLFASNWQKDRDNLHSGDLHFERLRKLVKLKQRSVCKCLCTPVHLQGRGGVRHLHSGGDMFAPGHTSTLLMSTVLMSTLLKSNVLTSTLLRSTVHYQATTLLASILLNRPQAESAEEGCLKLRHLKHQKYARRKHSYELADKEEGGCLRYSNSSWNSTLTKAWFRYRMYHISKFPEKKSN